MKKTYFAVLAVALAVLLAGCDGFLAPPEAGNEEGLKISFLQSDGSRALTKPIAAAGADFFEVVFDNGTRKVRTSWGGGRIGRILPGNGDYDNSGTGSGKGKAYIFAGRNGTLLGVGTLVRVINNDDSIGDGTAGGETVIDMDIAIEVVFDIYALNTDIGGLRNPTNTIFAPPKADGSNPALSTFKFPLGLGTYAGTNVGSLLLDDTQDPPLTAPVFIVDPSTIASGDGSVGDPYVYTTENATFDITDTGGSALTSTIQEAIIAGASTPSAGPGTPGDRNRVISNGFIWEAGNSPLGEVTGVVDSLTRGAQLPIPIPLTLTPGPKAGLSRISIEIPVFLYSDDPVAGTGKDRPTTNGAKPVQWYIRGGLNNTAVDQGAKFNDGDGSMGGAILIGVGEYNKNAAGLIISIGNYLLP